MGWLFLYIRTENILKRISWSMECGAQRAAKRIFTEKILSRVKESGLRHEARIVPGAP
jgi:hypothetical protein